MLQINMVKERLMFLSPSVQTGKEKEHTIADFETLEALGIGAFGQVSKVLHKQTKMIYALKRIPKQQIKSIGMVEQLKREVKIMYKLSHANIIKIFTHFEENEFVYLLLEFAEGGTLWSKLSNAVKFDERTAQKYAKEMVSALEYLHSRKPPIIHRDIKPENILLDKDGHIKLADFGWYINSALNEADIPRCSYYGCMDYLSPEMLIGAPQDIKLDYWHLGVLIYELLTGKTPFRPDSKEVNRNFKEWEANILELKINFPDDFPPTAKDLVSKLIKKDPKERISIAEIKKHPWLINSTSILKMKYLTAIDLEVKGQPNVQKEQPRVDKLEEKKKEKDTQAINASVQQKGDEYHAKLEDLNKMIADLRNENSQLKKKVELQDEKITSLTNENEALKNGEENNVVGAPDNKRVLLLEEENKKLKKELDEIWQSLETKEVELRKKSREVAKLEEEMALMEKYKKSLTKEVKDVQSKLTQAETKVLEVQQQKEEEKLELQKIIKETESKSYEKAAVGSGDQVLQEIVKNMQKTMEEMQNKINHYKENSANVKKLENELEEKEKRITSLEMLEQRNIELIKVLESEVKSSKGLRLSQEDTEAEIRALKTEIESLKANNESLLGLCKNLQTLKEFNEKEITQLKSQLQDHKLKEESPKKTNAKIKKQKLRGEEQGKK